MICSSSTHLLVSGFSPNRCGWWVTLLNQILLSYQVRATLLGSQAGRTTCRDRLLDLFVAVNRLRSPGGDGYIVDSVDDCNNVGSSSVRLLKPTDFKTGLEEETNLDEEENSILGKTTAINAENGFLDVEESEGKNLLEDFKKTDPDNWPSKEYVLEPIAEARGKIDSHSRKKSRTSDTVNSSNS